MKDKDRNIHQRFLEVNEVLTEEKKDDYKYAFHVLLRAMNE
jgi:hypothetical protein